jgi:hypothetical protein
MKKITLLIFCILWIITVEAQIKINEASNRNFTQIADVSGSNPDWIELYNSGDQPVDLWGYHLSDEQGIAKWTLPNVEIPANKWLLIFASGVDQVQTGINHWETAVREDDTWRWICPDSTTAVAWMKSSFDDTGWKSDQGGFGYGDGDDKTEIPMRKVSVYTRISFEVTDVESIVAAKLHVDYDDGFVAYLNGTEIASSNISSVEWNKIADRSHEAVMYQSQKPECFDLDLKILGMLLHNGKNVLAVECHNFTNGLIDMSLRSFLSFGLSGKASQFRPVPVWFKTDYDEELNANFKISSGGETIYLTDPNGILIDTLTLPNGLPVNSSVGSQFDGSSDRAIFLIGTPNATNENQIAFTEGMEAAPVVSLSGGFYPDPVTVSINTSAGSVFHYTTDGQTPKNTSPVYSGTPLVIDSSTVLKVRSFSTGHKLAGPVVTNSYFIGENPTPAGVLSITMDSADLFGESGIYDNWAQDWKKQCSIEYFVPGSHEVAVRQLSGIRIDGGAGGSRSQPQHSFRVEPGNGALGDGDIQYPLIPGRKDRTSYATFYLRNGSNQYLNYLCKDAVEVKCLGDSTYNTYSAFTPVQVYLNGHYWGLYELREKLDEDYFKQHFGTKEDSLDILSVSYWYGGALRAVCGKDPINRFDQDYKSFLSLDTESDNFWDEANRYFDLEYYTDYICAESWIADIDWPYNNIKIYRSPETGNRWRFCLIDVELSLNPNGWSDRNTDLIRIMLDYDTQNRYIHIWQKAMLNHRYRDYFINRYADLMNTAWTKERMTSIANEIAGVTRPELPAGFQRWGDPNISASSYIDWFNQLHSIMVDELSNRSVMVRNHLKSNLRLPKEVNITLNVEPAGSGVIQISTVKVPTYPFKGVWFDGVPVKIEAIPGPGYQFTRWDANSLLTDLSKSIFTDTLTRGVTFQAHFTKTTYSTKVIISEINYNSESTVDAGDWIEIWNYDQSVSANLNGWYFTDSDSNHSFRFPANTQIAPNSRLVVVNDQSKFKSVHPGVSYMGSFSFGLSGSGDAVKLYNAGKVLVSEVVFEDANPWPSGADGQGRTLELRNVSHSTNDPANWFDGCIGGSPGKAYSPCGDQIVFSEINSKSVPSYDHGDWVELRNISAVSQDISGWVFEDGVDSTGHSFRIPDGTQLRPHENFVVVQDVNKFRAINPGVINFAGPFVFGLKDTGEWIRAYGSNGKLRLSVRFRDTDPWPVMAASGGYTFELRDSLGIMNDGNTWFAGCPGGSPGRYYNSNCSAAVITDLAEKFEILAYPNPANDKVWLKFGETYRVNITLKNMLGETVLESIETGSPVVLNIGHLPAGIYILTATAESGEIEVIRLVKE